MFQIKITGIPKVISDLKKTMSADMLDKALNHVLTEARNMARNHYAPVKTGFLKEMIYKRKVKKLVWVLGCDAPYAVFHEFGSYNIDTGTPENPKLVKSGYSPFLRPAIWKSLKMLQRYMDTIIK